MKRAWGPIFTSSASLRHWLPSIEQLPLCWQENFYLWRSEPQWRFSKKCGTLEHISNGVGDTKWRQNNLFGYLGRLTGDHTESLIEALAGEERRGETQKLHSKIMFRTPLGDECGPHNMYRPIT